MNCVNCKSRLFFMNDTEELYPGSELVFCYACRKKVNPFLEERNTYLTHALHLEAWRRELESTGVTPSGMAALSSYCAYLDRISPKRQEVAAAQTQATVPSTTMVAKAPAMAQVVSAKEITGKIIENQNKIEELSDRVDSMHRRLKVAIFAACTGGAASFGSLIALLVYIIGA